MRLKLYFIVSNICSDWTFSQVFHGAPLVFSILYQAQDEVEAQNGCSISKPSCWRHMTRILATQHQVHNLQKQNNRYYIST